jgi:hypothetical protein
MWRRRLPSTRRSGGRHTDVTLAGDASAPHRAEITFEQADLAAAARILIEAGAFEDVGGDADACRAA